MNVVMLRKGNATYACETAERLERFKAAGWVEETPPTPHADDSAGDQTLIAGDDAAGDDTDKPKRRKAAKNATE